MAVSGSACPINCFECADPSNCNVCKYGYANIAGACETAWTQTFSDKCCRSQIPLLTPSALELATSKSKATTPIDLQACFRRAFENEECGDTIFVTTDRAKNNRVCSCVKLGDTCSTYSCSGIDVFERKALSIQYDIVESRNYCAHLWHQVHPSRCLVSSLLPSFEIGIAQNRCEAACSRYPWCVGYSSSLHDKACSLVSSTGECPVGTPSLEPVASQAKDLMCAKKVSYIYDWAGTGSCEGSAADYGNPLMLHSYYGFSDLSQCQYLCNAWPECQGFDVDEPITTRCILWARVSHGNNKSGHTCYTKRLMTNLTVSPSFGVKPSATSQQVQSKPKEILSYVGYAFMLCLGVLVMYFMIRRWIKASAEIGEGMKSSPADIECEALRTDTDSQSTILGRQ